MSTWQSQKGPVSRAQVSCLQGLSCAPVEAAGRFRTMDEAEAGKYRFGVVDVTMERNSVRFVQPRQSANGTLNSYGASFVEASRTVSGH
jgi:hypothetical protein